MSKFQLLACHIVVAGNKDSVTVRDATNPVTYPELLVLRAVHGGEQNVHTVVAVGVSDERANMVEFQRLLSKYGTNPAQANTVRNLFPQIGDTVQMRLADEKFPTAEEVEEGNKAAAEARKAVRSKKKTKPKPKPQPKAAPKSGAGETASTAVPARDDLPT